jgi:hypothetical protein
VFYAVIAAVLGRRGVTDKLAGFTMSLAFLGLLLTIAVGLIFAAFVATAVLMPQNHP